MSRVAGMGHGSGPGAGGAGPASVDPRLRSAPVDPPARPPDPRRTVPAGPPGPGDDLLQALRSGRIQGDEARLAAATDLLESSFYQELFKALRDTVPEDGLTSGGQGEEIFSSLLDQHLAEVSARRSDGGLGSALYRHFLSAGGGGVP